MNEHIQYLTMVKDTCYHCHQCHCYHSTSLIGKYCYGEIAEKLLDGTTNALNDSIFGCHECGLCLNKCPRKFNAKEFMFHARYIIESQNKELCNCYSSVRVDQGNDVFSEIKKENNIVYDGALMKDEDCEILFVPGCHLSSSFPFLTNDLVTFLKKKNIINGMTSICCGNPLYASGQYKAFQTYANKMKDLYEKHHVKTIITPCPSCYDFNQRLKNMGYLQNIDILCLSEVLVNYNLYIDRNKFPEDYTVSIHDSCPDRKNGIFSNSIRELYKDFEIKELPHIKENTLCCGCGGLVPMYSKNISTEGKDIKINDYKQVNTNSMITTCFNCYKGLKEQIPIQHYLFDLLR